MCKRKMTFWSACFALVACVGLTGAHAADTVIGQIEVKNGAAGTPGATGASAYQIWLANGNTGSEADFLASLVGATGPQGVAGKDGTSVKIKGTVSSCANLPNNADIGDIYMVTAQGNQGYIYDGTSWHCPEAGINIQGPQGPQGPAGSACLSTVTSQTCGPNETVKCAIQSKSGTIYTKTDCNGQNPTSDTIYNGDDGANGTPGCADKVDISDKNAQGCYTITKTPYSLVSGNCTAGTPVNKLVCDGAAGTNGTNCEPTFSSAHDATNKKTVVTISGCGSTSTVDIPDGQDGNDGAPGCATTLTKSKTGKVTTITAKDCNNTTLWTETVSDGNDGADGQDGAPGCADKVDISDKNAQGCYTITKTPYSLVSGTCTAGTPVNKLVCDGAAGTNGTNCEPTFSSAHDATNKKTVVTISGCGSTSTVDIPDGQDGNDGAPGTNGVGICDNVANPATAVKTYTKTYTAPTATKAGYVRLAQTMCNDNTNSTDYEDTCVPIVSSNKDICSGNGGMYMECVRQDTSAVYNICRPITTQNASAISTAIDAAQSAAETYTDNAVANKVTSSDVNSAISTALSDYDTSTQVTNKITSATSDKVTNSALNTTLSSYLQTANLGTALKDTDLKDDVASAVSASGALSGYLTSANAAETYATQSSVADKQDALTTAQLAAVNSGITSNKITTYDGYATTIANKADVSALNTANGKITALETTVGDSSSGLVAQVNTNTNAIGDSTSGLTKAVADATSTANTASTNATQAKQDAASALSGLDAKLDKTTASSTYLSKTDANSTYLTKTSASSTYATKSALSTVETTANNAASDADAAVRTANTASTNATAALNKANANESDIDALDATVNGNGTASKPGLVSTVSTLQTTVSGHTTSINTLTSKTNTLETTVNGTCSGGNSELGGTSGKGSSECTQSLESRIRALETAARAAGWSI